VYIYTAATSTIASAVYNYHPNIKSDTCPRTPLPGDACIAGCADKPPGAISPGFAKVGSLPPWPGLLNADADGASLIGVPTGGAVCGTRAPYESVDSSSLDGAASSVWISGDTGVEATEAAKGLRATGEPRRASA
jgi:hypothetical protein